MPDPARSREPEADDETNGPLRTPVSWETLRSSPGGRSAASGTPSPARGFHSRSDAEPCVLASDLIVLAILCLGVSACDDKKAQNNAPTKPDSTKTEPQTDQSAPSPQKR